MPPGVGEGETLGEGDGDGDGDGLGEGVTSGLGVFSQRMEYSFSSERVSVRSGESR